MNSLLKKPAAWIPIALPLIVLTVMLIGFALSGTPTRQPAEGTAAHLFQIWLVLQVLTMVFFAISWLPQKPKQALLILVIQFIAALAACAPVYYFKL